MKTDTMTDAIGMIDAHLIAEARCVQTHRRHRFLKPITAAAAAVLCITAPLPAATVCGSEAAYAVLYQVAPGIAQTFKPVQKSCTDNGIRMDVISADITGSEASIYIALQDLEGSRIDATTDLFDSYSLRCPYDTTGHCSFSAYDEETGMAYFLVQIKRMDGKPIKHGKITFSVRELLYGKQKFEGVLPGMALDNVPYHPDTQRDLPFRGAGYKDVLPDYESLRYLIPADPPLLSPCDGVSVTGIGYIDGALHIQAYYADIGHTDNHGWLCLADSEGAPVEYDGEFDVSFWDDAQKGSYEEKIIKMPYEEIENYQLYGEFVTCSGYESGNWKVTFDLGNI